MRGNKPWGKKRGRERIKVVPRAEQIGISLARITADS